MKRIIKTLVIFATLSSVIYAVQASQTRSDKWAVARGEKLYMSYCASCHGLDGSGDGPVASSLKRRPNDLRRIQSRHGIFPAEEVARKIAGDLSAPIHGTKDMPVWGLILNEADINRLVKYLKSIQRVYPPESAG